MRVITMDRPRALVRAGRNAALPRDSLIAVAGRGRR